nr:hypothetical protein [Pseudarthrobacter sp. L1SW]
MGPPDGGQAAAPRGAAGSVRPEAPGHRRCPRSPCRPPVGTVSRGTGSAGVGALGQQPEFPVGFSHPRGGHHQAFGQVAANAAVGHRLCAAPRARPLAGGRA